MRWELDSYGQWWVHGREVSIWIEPRPHYCDRGNFIAKLDIHVGSQMHRHHEIDAADRWPRYYMSLERAKLECEDWLKKRKQWIE